MNVTVALLTLAAAVTNLFLGLLVWYRNRKNKVNLSLAIFAFSTSLWILSNFLLRIFSNYYLLRLTFSLGALVPVTAIAWIIFFIGKPSRLYKVILWSTTAAAVIFMVLPFFGDSIIAGNLTSTDPFASFTRGALFDYYAFYTSLAIFIPIGLLASTYKLTTGLKRMQYKFVMFGVSLFGAFTMAVSLVMPLMGIEKYSAFDFFSSLFFVGFATYAIVKYRLLDIRMVVARSVAFTVLIVSMASFYGLSVMGLEAIFFPGRLGELNMVESIIRTVLAVIMAFSFQPLRRWVTKATDKIFFKNQYDPEQLLDTLAHTIGATIILIELVYKTLDLIITQMKVTRGILVILSDTGASIYNSQAVGYGESPKIVPEDMIRLAKDGIILYDELEENSHYKSLLRKYNASVGIPLKTEGGVEGVLLLGEKQSGDMYSQADLKVFEIMAPEIAVAITNAKSYEKIERFNVTLRQEIKKATAELEHKNEQLMELDKAKDEFISMASHQLRTPLTAIKGYLSMLLEGDAGEIKVSQYDFVNEAFNGANRMVGLINDLLNVSRMETGRFFLEPVDVDMENLVAEEMKQLQNNAKEKKLYLKYEKKGHGKIPHIQADETKIRQVVMNFIDNALYYTTEGGVTVTLEADSKDVTFTVKDTGIGVPKEAQKNLFTKFYRADNARHVRPDGTGLGIYLAKRVIDDHGGEIIFHSKIGEGSTFGFKFPIKSKLKMKRVSAPAPTAAGTPAIGELAAGIGVAPEALEATKLKVEPEIAKDNIDIAKAAGVEAPLPDSPDAKDMAKEAEAIKAAATK
jgi:signal transduction histidine kinase/MFS family permease